MPTGHVDVASLQRTALALLVAVVANALSFVLLAILISLAINDRSLTAVMAIDTLFFLGTGILSLIILSLWVGNAYGAACRLRRIEPRFSPTVLSLLSFLSPLVCGLPISYALDFICVRVASPDKKTMQWYSAGSRSFAVNVFAIFCIASCTLLILPAFVSLHTTTRGGCIFLGLILLVAALLVGVHIVFATNRKIVVLAGAS